ncbi:MAG: 3-dehydroquinate synthase [Tepidiphilus sp.]|nr:3-dehydroquinate synthase [Tepidiphilus sp.]MDD3433924.1 3-dehydroquinate synthase [Tepidiphilus sp.]
MRELAVDLGERSYPIFIGSGVLTAHELLLPNLEQPRAVLVTNETVAPLYLERVTTMLERHAVRVDSVVLPDGEQYKNWQTLEKVYDTLVDTRAERATPLIALGGGVVGDMTGFAAATWQRGAPFVQMPTTLLAQVDSSVGGKTAINHPRGKNMIGAFHQPRAVLIDTDTLATLPLRELRAGLAEVIKYGLIRDASFFDWLEGHMEALLALEPGPVAFAIERSCRNKAEVVVADETERGERALLNLGHTFGHAIETGTGYVGWLHGEAVAVGMLMAAEVSLRLGWIDEGELARIEGLLIRAGLPVRGPGLPVDEMLHWMAGDKKVSGGQLRLVLLQGIGKAVVTADVLPSVLRAAIEARR